MDSAQCRGGSKMNGVMPTGSLRISFLLPVMNETYLLEQTVTGILKAAPDDVEEILIVTADRTTPEAMAVVQRLMAVHPGLIWHHRQTLPFLGGAMQEAFSLAKGDHVMLMSSDMETDPAVIPQFIVRMREGNSDIVAASRWIRGGGFTGYSTVKWLLNWGFQQVFRWLYWCQVTDLTYAYRLYKRDVLAGIRWEELKHPFLLESLLKPLRLGARLAEVPALWRARTEGTSGNSLWATFKYLRIATRVRFMPLTMIREQRP